MTTPRGRQADVASETVTFHKADGTPTTNKDEAVTAEITTTMKDGTVRHAILQKDGTKLGQL